TRMGPRGWLCLLCLVLPWVLCQGTSRTQPEQVHLSYPGDPTAMTVTWTTFDPAGSIVEFGLEPGEVFTTSAKGHASRFVDGGWLRRSMFIHRVTLRGLAPGQRYAYRCGSPLGWSRLYGFRALQNGTNWSPRLAVFGDMGNINPQSLPRLQRDTQQGMYDAILHVGRCHAALPPGSWDRGWRRDGLRGRGWDTGPFPSRGRQGLAGSGGREWDTGPFPSRGRQLPSHPCQE
uniref:Acid phosphatase 7, tartrate resistant (putative) n=1 Tax=Terrapene triunguis TaxID=2587831 RepID=A0A674JHB2_9SAUR